MGTTGMGSFCTPEEIVRLQQECVDRWHQVPVDNRYDGFLAAVCTQHQFNYWLWHEEDIARSPDVSDTKIAEVKRNIDRFNQQRNDWIEKLDDLITAHLERTAVKALPEARQNTETAGSVIDRLSILALRLYHVDEQLRRTDATPEHLEKCRGRMQVCLRQHADLTHGLTELLEDLLSGRKRHRTYRQLKMYNDPSLNPYLYGRRQAG
jgi:hypothetical protein